MINGDTIQDGQVLDFKVLPNSWRTEHYVHRGERNGWTFLPVRSSYEEWSRQIEFGPASHIDPIRPLRDEERCEALPNWLQEHRSSDVAEASEIVKQIAMQLVLQRERLIGIPGAVTQYFVCYGSICEVLGTPFDRGIRPIVAMPTPSGVALYDMITLSGCLLPIPFVSRPVLKQEWRQKADNIAQGLKSFLHSTDINYDLANFAYCQPDNPSNCNLACGVDHGVKYINPLPTFLHTHRADVENRRRVNRYLIAPYLKGGA